VTASEDLDTTLIELEWLELSASKAVPAAVAKRMRVSAYRDEHTKDVVYTLTTHLLAERLPPVEETASTCVRVPVPATWWDHWKAAHADAWYARWLVRCRPPRYVEETRKVTLTVELRRYRCFPESRYVLPDALGPGRPIAVLGSKRWAVEEHDSGREEHANAG
jgi:hypothetical protein